MKSTIVLAILGLCALTSASENSAYKVGDLELLLKYKEVYGLLRYINQDNPVEETVAKAADFEFEGKYEQWTKPDYAYQFYYNYKHNKLPRGDVFSVFYPEHLKKAIDLYRVFYYAKDFETFIKVAAWARNNVNNGLFLYAFSVAVVHSQWTQEIILPPIYEINPQFFFNNEIINRVQQRKQQAIMEKTADSKPTRYTIFSHYKSLNIDQHPGKSMSYFTEDVGVNGHYYMHHIYQPFWMHKEDTVRDLDHRGDYFFWYHQQILARYYMERLSNGFGEIPEFSYDLPIATGFIPSLTYPNGLHFPTRPNEAQLFYNGAQCLKMYGNFSHSYTFVQDYERRLRDVLDTGYFYTPEDKRIPLYNKDGVEILGNLVESNADSLSGEFYGNLLMYSRYLLGYSYFPLDKHKVVPSALEHYETSMRDPMFYQLYKRIIYFYYQHQNRMGPYPNKDLIFDGVKIQGVTVGKLLTHFDFFWSDLDQATYAGAKEFEDDSFEAQIRQQRLNHEPFEYKINVTSEKPCESIVKVFIGPKYDEYGRVIPIEENRKNFFEIDRFRATLAAGDNVIKRNSFDSPSFSHDRTAYFDFMSELEHIAENNTSEDISFKYQHWYRYFGFPESMILPRGDAGGRIYQFYVFIAPYHAPTKTSDFTKAMVDTEYSFGYPLDRPIKFGSDFLVPNSYFKDVPIYHTDLL